MWSAAAAVIDRAPIGSDEKLRLQHYTLLLFLGLPAMSIFGVVAGLRGQTTLCVATFVTVTGLFLGWYLIRRGVRPVLVYRTNYIVFTSLLLYIAVIGGEGGGKILWSYTFPLIGFFLFRLADIASDHCRGQSLRDTVVNRDSFVQILVSQQVQNRREGFLL